MVAALVFLDNSLAIRAMFDIILPLELDHAFIPNFFTSLVGMPRFMAPSSKSERSLTSCLIFLPWLDIVALDEFVSIRFWSPKEGAVSVYLADLLKSFLL